MGAGCQARPLGDVKSPRRVGAGGSLSVGSDAHAGQHLSQLGGSDRVEIVRYCDSNQVTLVLVGQEPVTLMDTANILGETPVALAQPGRA